MRKTSLEEYMTESGLLMPEQIDEVKPLVDESKGITLEKLLVEHGFVTEEMVANAKSYVNGYGFAYVNELELIRRA